MDQLTGWARDAVGAIRSGSAWERFDFTMPSGAPLPPVIDAFSDLTEALALDSVDVSARLYVPVPEEGPFPSLQSLSPWDDNLVPQLYLLTHSAATAWLDRVEVWTELLDDPLVAPGITMRGLTATDRSRGGEDTSRHLVLRRDTVVPPTFDTVD